MKVAANLAWLVPGRVGGSEEYTVRLLAAVLSAAPADIDLRIIGSPALFAAHPELAAAECVALRGPLHLRPWRIAMESTEVHRSTRDVDVVHHFGGRVPARHHGNDVVTVHDLQPLHLPENFSWVKRRYLGAVLPRSVRDARLVVTPSEWVASSVVDAFGVDPGRVRAVSSTWDGDDTVDSSLAALVEGRPVVLYPAVTHPHKRHALLLAAMDEVVASRPEVALVLTGGAGRAEAEVRAAMGRSAATVIHPGRVPAPVLRGLYRDAAVLAFPSAYEGFGLPVLEAMRGGVPVVSSTATALGEIVGDTATTVESADPGEWAAAILETVAGGPAVAERTAAARARAEFWSPPNAAARLLDAWRSIA